MSDQGTCEWCGNPIPPRTDPRGRKPRFCSNACRAAATRDRNRHQHAADLEAARTQMVLPVESLEERQDAARATLEETTAGVLDGQPVTDRTAELIKAAYQLVGLTEPPQGSPKQKLTTRPNRAQRRKAGRRGRQ